MKKNKQNDYSYPVNSQIKVKLNKNQKEFFNNLLNTGVCFTTPNNRYKRKVITFRVADRWIYNSFRVIKNSKWSVFSNTSNKICLLVTFYPKSQYSMHFTNKRKFPNGIKDYHPLYNICLWLGNWFATKGNMTVENIDINTKNNNILWLILKPIK